MLFSFIIEEFLTQLYYYAIEEFLFLLFGFIPNNREKWGWLEVGALGDNTEVSFFIESCRNA